MQDNTLCTENAKSHNVLCITVCFRVLLYYGLSNPIMKGEQFLFV